MQTHSLSALIHTLSFSYNGVLMHSDRGSTCGFLASTTCFPYQTILLELFVEQEWIAYESTRVIWLRSEYWGDLTAV